ncbi:MAG TPA: glycosyltransferase family 4 protein [Chitinophagaceae bacterium]
MKKVCIIVSQIDRAIAFEWTVEGLSKQFDFSFVLIGKKGSFLSRYLKEKGIEAYEIECSGKKDALRAVWKVFNYLRKKKVDVVHTHLVEATLYGLLPAWILRIKRRIYTRHHSDYNYKYSPKGIKYDKLSNWWATDIIAITEQVRQLLIERENVSPKKITLIHHGIDTTYFKNQDEQGIRELSAKYNPQSRQPVIGVIARQTHWKGIQYTIPAFAELLKTHPDALLILANASGDYEAEIDRMLAAQLPAGSYLKIKYEYDTSSLYKLFDVYVHVPIDEVVEAFGQVYVEALAAGTPSVFTLSGIALDFIKDRHNAVVVPHCNSEAIGKAIAEVLTNDSLRSTIISNGREVVEEKFSLQPFFDKLSHLYEK